MVVAGKLVKRKLGGMATKNNKQGKLSLQAQDSELSYFNLPVVGPGLLARVITVCEELASRISLEQSAFGLGRIIWPASVVNHTSFFLSLCQNFNCRSYDRKFFLPLLINLHPLTPQCLTACALAHTP